MDADDGGSAMLGWPLVQKLRSADPRQAHPYEVPYLINRISECDEVPDAVPVPTLHSSVACLRQPAQMAHDLERRLAVGEQLGCFEAVVISARVFSSSIYANERWWPVRHLIPGSGMPAPKHTSSRSCHLLRCHAGPVLRTYASTSSLTQI